MENIRTEHENKSSLVQEHTLDVEQNPQPQQQNL